MTQFMRLNAWVRETTWRRFLAVLAALWAAAIVVFALLAARDDGLELYRWTMLGLLIVGVPFSIFAVGYAYSLLGRSVRRSLLWVAGIAALAVVALAGVNGWRRTQHAEIAVNHDGRQDNPSKADYSQIIAEMQAEDQVEQSRRRAAAEAAAAVDSAIAAGSDGDATAGGSATDATAEAAHADAPEGE